MAKRITSEEVTQQAKIIAENVSGGESQASQIAATVLSQFELVHDKNKDVFAVSKSSGEVYAIQSRAFKDNIVSRFYSEKRMAVRDQSLREALITITGIGRCNGPLKEINTRHAKHDGNYILDLCIDGSSRAVEISPGEWRIIEKPATLFIRPQSMQPLPTPVSSNALNSLFEICNIPESHRILTIAWLIECMRPETPYPILELIGEQGSAKSTTQKNLRRLIDPNACDLRAAPKCVDDIFVSAGSSGIVSYENISHLNPAMQDAFCVLSTGGGYAKRKLYSDADEAIINVKRPLIINSISAVITQQDAVDRAITIDLPVIEKRVEISSIQKDFEKNHSIILGCLLDIFATALIHLPSVSIPAKKCPRLIEFARLGIAVEKVLHAEPGEFLRQFNASRQESIARTLDASPVATAIQEILELEPCGITGPLKKIMSLSEKYRHNSFDAWPRTPKGFGDALRRAAPALRQVGIECICLGKIGGAVKWSITKNLDNSSPASPDVLPEIVVKQDIRTCRTSSQQLSPNVSYFTQNPEIEPHLSETVKWESDV